MSKRIFGVVAVLMVATMVLTACGSASAQPDVCKTDPFGCAMIKPGQTIKIGMGAPMTGDNAAFGQDISQGAKIAMTDAGKFQGFSFELVAQDDGGTAEGGAAVANKFVSDPTIVAIEGHIFSGATKAAIPIYEKAGLPMMSPSATNPDLTKTGSKVFNRLVFTDAFQGKSAAEYLYQHPEDHEACHHARWAGLRPGIGPGCQRYIYGARRNRGCLPGHYPRRIRLQRRFG